MQYMLEETITKEYTYYELLSLLEDLKSHIPEKLMYECMSLFDDLNTGDISEREAALIYEEIKEGYDEITLNLLETYLEIRSKYIGEEMSEDTLAKDIATIKRILASLL